MIASPLPSAASHRILTNEATHLVVNAETGAVVGGIDPSGWERGLAALAGRHFDLHLLHVMDPAECEPGERGDLLLRDCEGGEELPVTAGPGLLKAYRKEVGRFREEVKTWCARHQAGYSFVLTDAHFDDVVLRLFRREGLIA